MRWFRSNRAAGGGLALAALALQLAVSFAHVHPLNVFGRPGAAPAKISLAASKWDQRVATVSAAREAGGQSEVYCDICATIGLVGSSQIAEAPGLPPLFGTGDSRFTPRSDFTAADRRHVLFQSRAPPLA